MLSAGTRVDERVIVERERENSNTCVLCTCMYVDTFCVEDIMLVARDKYWDFNEAGI